MINCSSRVRPGNSRDGDSNPSASFLPGVTTFAPLPTRSHAERGSVRQDFPATEFCDQQKGAVAGKRAEGPAVLPALGNAQGRELPHKGRVGPTVRGESRKMIGPLGRHTGRLRSFTHPGRCPGLGERGPFGAVNSILPGRFRLSGCYWGNRQPGSTRTAKRMVFELGKFHATALDPCGQSEYLTRSYPPEFQDLILNSTSIRCLAGGTTPARSE